MTTVVGKGTVNLAGAWWLHLQQHSTSNATDLAVLAELRCTVAPRREAHRICCVRLPCCLYPLEKPLLIPSSHLLAHMTYM